MFRWRFGWVFAFVAVCSLWVGRVGAEQVDPSPLKVRFLNCNDQTPYVGRHVTGQLHHEDGGTLCDEVSGVTGLDGCWQFPCSETPQYSCDYWDISIELPGDTVRDYTFIRVSHTPDEPCYRVDFVAEWEDETIVGNCDGASYDEITGWWTVFVSPPPPSWQTR